MIRAYKIKQPSTSSTNALSTQTTFSSEIQSSLIEPSPHFRQKNRPQCRIGLKHSLRTKENKVKNVILPQYIYIHTHTQTNTHAHTHTHIYIYIQTNTHTHIQTHTHTTHIYTYIYIQTNTCTHSHTHAHTHTHRVRGREREEEELVSWCFEPSQLQRITSGLSHSFHKSSFHKSCFVVVFLAYLYSAGTQHGNLHPAG